MKISNVHEREVFKHGGRIGIVTGRWCADRSSGGTEVTYEDGGSVTFLWDYENPEVEYLGKGKLVVSIVLDNDANPARED